MTKSVATQLVVFAGLMLILFGLKTGLSEHYLEPTGITENVRHSEQETDGRLTEGSDVQVLSCGTAWSPYRAVDGPRESVSHSNVSKLSAFGESRCEVVLAGTGWTAALLTISGSGLWFIMLFWAIVGSIAARLQIREAEEDLRIRQKVADERRRRERAASADRGSGTASD